MSHTLTATLLSALVTIGIQFFLIPSAQAAEFRCSVEPCRLRFNSDGAVPSKESHQVFNLSSLGTSVNITCNQLTGESTVAVTPTTELSFKNLEYDGCGGFEVKMNECEYRFGSAGTLSIVCPAGRQVEIRWTNGFFPECRYTVGAQGPFAGVSISNTIKLEPKQIRVANAAEGISVGLFPSSGACGFSNPTTLKFETARVLLTAESDPEGTVASARFE